MPRDTQYGIRDEAAAQAPRVVRLDAASGGRTFEGIGGITSNGMSKLLMDYPEDVRRELLALLFEPNFGASLQHLKVEIGSDVNTSSGTEPSHMRSRGDFDIRRGVGLPIARLAKEIRPELILDALRWGTPRWIGNYEDKLAYYLNFLRGAREAYGLEFDYLGPDINEGAFDRDWTVEALRPGLDREGFAAVKLVADDSDQGWEIAERAAADEALLRVVHAYGVHYRKESTETARGSGKPLWLSEDLAPFRHSFAAGALFIGKRMIDMYVTGKMVKYELHPLVEGEYENVPFNYKGILVTTWPWSGHYRIDPGLWVVAHFTQFAQPGWTYVDGGCAADDEAGHVTLLAPDGSGDYSIVVVNAGDRERTYRFEPGLGFAAGKEAHVWRTDEREQFIRIGSLTGDELGGYVLKAAPRTVYTLSTTTGQRRGADELRIPAETAFPLPYADDWTMAREGTYYPKYTLDQGGAFELVPAASQEIALRQRLDRTQIPIDWTYRSTPEPYTLLGSLKWTNYKVSVEAQVGSEDGYMFLAGRVHYTDKSGDPPQGGRFVLRPDGRYELWSGKALLACGRTDPFAPDAWRRIELRFENDNIEVRLDGATEPLLRVRDGRLPAGQVALGSGYHHAAFRRLRVEPLGESVPASCVRLDDRHETIRYKGEWTAAAGDFGVYARTVHRSNTPGASLSLRFCGRSVRLIGSLTEDGGMADVFVDGDYRGTLDCYSLATQYRKSLLAIHGLDESVPHLLTLAVTGKRRAEATDDFVTLDAVEIVSAGGPY